MLAHLLLEWALGAILLLVVAQVVPGFRITGIGPALAAVLTVALINATLGLLLKVVFFPLTLVTFGVFLLVINAIVLKVTAALLPGFSVRGFLPALIAAVLLSLLHLLVRVAFHARPIHV